MEGRGVLMVDLVIAHDLYISPEAIDQLREWSPSPELVRELWAAELNVFWPTMQKVNWKEEGF